MLLTDLPPELLRKILASASTPSFVQLIRTCHTIYDLAEDSRDIIQHHLNNIPGERRAICGAFKSTRELFLLLRRRAAASLQGVNITADRQDFYISDASLDLSASCVSAGSGHNVALVQKSGSLVQLYEAFQGELKLRRVLKSDSPDMIKYIPVKTAFDQMKNIFVLYSIENNKQSANSKRRCFEPSGKAILTRFSLSSPSCPRESWEIGRPRYRGTLRRTRSMRPVDMVAHGGERVSIAWDCGLYIRNAVHPLIRVCTLFKGDWLSISKPYMLTFE
jgi:F-box domain